MRELWPWLLLSVCVAVVATGLGLVAYAAFVLPGPLPASAPDSSGLTERAIGLALALVVPAAGMVAAWACDTHARLPGRHERRPTLRVALLALLLAFAAGAGWGLVWLV